MTFIELVENVADNTGLPKKVVKTVLKSTAERIQVHVRSFEGDVKWVKLGRFKTGKTRAGKAFGKDLTPRNTIKFTPYDE